MQLLQFALLWLPFSVALFTFEIYGVTFTLYIFAILAACVVASWRVVTGRARDPSPWATAALVLLNLQAFLFLFGGPSAASVGFFGYDTATPQYKYVHGLLVPSASYIALKLLVTTEGELRRAVLCFVLGSSAFALVYIVVSIGSESLARVVVLDRDAVTAACFFSVALIFAVFTPVFGRRLSLTFAGLNGLALLMTLSRGFLVATFLLSAIGRKTRPSAMLVGFSAFIAVTLLATFVSIANKEVFRPQEWDPRLENSLERLMNVEYWKSGVYGRLDTFGPSVRGFEEAPILGMGFASAQAGTTVHNFHLEWLQISGIVGYVLFCFIFVGHFVRLARSCLYDGWVVATSLSIAVIFVNGLLNGVMHGVMPYILFVVLGLGDAYIGFGSRRAVGARTRIALDRVVGRL